MKHLKHLGGKRQTTGQPSQRSVKFVESSQRWQHQKEVAETPSLLTAAVEEKTLAHKQECSLVTSQGLSSFTHY